MIPQYSQGNKVAITEPTCTLATVSQQMLGLPSSTAVLFPDQFSSTKIGVVAIKYLGVDCAEAWKLPSHA